MPETFPQMLWCAFYTGGAVGGWIVLVLLGLDIRNRRRK